MSDERYENEIPEETEIISMTDSEGERIDFAVLDTIEAFGSTYIVVSELPPEEDEEDDMDAFYDGLDGADGCESADEPEDDEDEDFDDSVLIFRVETDADGSENYVLEEDDDKADWLFSVYCIDTEEYEVGEAE